MKGKFLTIAILGTLLVGSNAFATIARQAVMGGTPLFSNGAANTLTTINGSLWYDDDYNVFYNPSFVNDNKNYAVVQKGFEGGWFKSEFENFVYGVYVNRGGTGNAAANYGAGNLVAPGLAAKAGIVGSATTLSTQRPIDFFFAGDTGLKWGLHIGWAYNREQVGATKNTAEDGEITARYWRADFGVQAMGFEPFIGVTMFSKYENTYAGQKSDQDLNAFNAGFRYKYEGWVPYFVFNKHRESGKSNLNTPQAQVRMQQFGVGFGHDTKVADGVHIHKGLSVWKHSVEDDTAAAGTAPTTATVVPLESNKDFNDTVIPINVALEAEATSWLTLRGGVQYDLINERVYARSNATAANSLGDKKVSLAGNARFRIGSTLKFGKLHVDSAFGNGAAAAAGTSTATTNLDSTATGFDGQTFALVSASYHW